MIFKPQQLGKISMEESELERDRKNCRKFGPCGVGDKAIYLNSFYIDRRYYILFSSVTRAYKRIAMSKGGFSGKGIFATQPYLVVEYDNGKEKQCCFKHEEHVDQLLAYVSAHHPEIKVHSVAAEKKLAEKAKLLAGRKAANLSGEAVQNIKLLEKSRDFLERKPDLYNQMTFCARKKRTFDNTNPAYKWVALFIMLLGLATLGYGIYAFLNHAGFAMYFLVFGLMAVFLFSGANVLPTARNNKRYIENQLEKSVSSMSDYIRKQPDFPLPARYAHPNVLKRMIDILSEGRASTSDSALSILKSDLKALNSSVSVEQEEFDEIMSIKPLFLINDYQ